MAHKLKVGPLTSHEVKLGDRGRLVLPAAVRKRLGWRSGDRLIVILEDSGEIRLASLRQQMQRCAGMFRNLAKPGVSLSEELLADRRREAAREERE